jgi:hypothetical protein
MTGHDPVSPELVLVDPDLRRQLLDAEMRDLLELAVLASQPPPLSHDGERDLESPHGSHLKHSRVRSRLGIAGYAALAVFVLVLPSLAFLPPRQQPTLGTPVERPPSPGRIEWSADPNADYYLVEFLVDGRLAAVIRQSEPAAPIPVSLASHLTTWHVFAGYGPVASHNTRGPIATGSIVPGTGA